MDEQDNTGQMEIASIKLLKEGKLLALFLIASFISHSTPKAQDLKQVECPFCEETFEYIPDRMVVHDTTYVYISTLDDVTRKLGLSYDEYVKRFLLFLQKRDVDKQYASDQIYLNYFLPMLKNVSGFSDKRWIDGIFTLYASPDTTFMNYHPVPLSDSLPETGQNLDILFECRGDKNTDYFLRSPHLIDRCLVQIFKSIYDANHAEEQKIKGIHFYFPDFSFKEKRAMAQFAKSVSLVTDSCRLKEIRSLKVYFSFDQAAEAEKEYLSCIADMTDGIFIYNNTNTGRVFSPTTVITRKDADRYFLLSKIINQFYLASYNTDFFPVTSWFDFRSGDVIKLIHSDYPDNNWEIHAVSLSAILVLSLLVFILYRTVPAFSYYLNKNRDYMITLILMLIFEVFLLLFSMIEALSRGSVFDFTNENRSILFFAPFVLIFITPLLKMVRRRGETP